MKIDAWKKDTVYPGISGSSHVATAADVFSVKRDVRVGKAQINIATTGVFKVAIYEWAEGVGRIGNPIYQNDTTYNSTGVFTYDFGGVLLKAGKTYWIGRYEDTGGASANRTLSAVVPNETYKHVTWLGGTSYTSTTLAYPTTYYYFYGLEFEAEYMKVATPKKSARGYGKKNIVEGMSSDNWTLRAGTTYKRVEGRRTYWNSNADYAGIQLILSKMGISDSEFQGKTITYGGTTHPLATVMLYYRKGDGTPTYVGVAKPTDNGSKTVTIPVGASEIRIYVQSDAGGRGELWCEDVFLNFGTDSAYSLYEPAPKPAKLYPERNLIPDFNSEEWFQDSTTAGGTLSVDVDNPYRATITTTASAQGRLLWIPVEIGKTYTFSFGKFIGLLRLYKDRVTFHDNPKNIFQGATPVPITITPDDTYRGFITLRLTLGSAGTITLEDLRLQEGDSTVFAPMKLTKMKPLL